MNIYTNPQLYDAIHHDYKWDAKLIRSIADKIDGPVLELASGTGRLSQEIIDLDLEYFGLELSQSFLEMAKNKHGDRAKFVQGDMRDFDLAKKFNFIFISFNSFSHNLTLKDARSCLDCVNAHLFDNGRFLLSVFIPDLVSLDKKNDKLYPVTDYFQFQNSRCRIMQSNQYDPNSQINNLTWVLEKGGELDQKKYHYSMRMFYPHEMDILLSESGFIIKDKFGDYDRSPMNAESGMQIYVCET